MLGGDQLRSGEEGQDPRVPPRPRWATPLRAVGGRLAAAFAGRDGARGGGDRAASRVVDATAAAAALFATATAAAAASVAALAAAVAASVASVAVVAAVATAAVVAVVAAIAAVATALPRH